MQNPYSHATAGAATPEDQKQIDYETAIGQNAEYYLPKFEAYDSGSSKLGWNWPAFFVTTPWFWYRKMWGWGFANVAWFWLVLVVVMPIVMGVTAAGADGEDKQAAVGKALVFVGLLWAIPWFLFPMFANSLYWKHINGVIRNVPPNLRDHKEKRAARIERNGGVGSGAMIAVVLGGGLVLLFFVGILAAIAIPAYQDYTIRGQSMEAFTLAAGPKAAVAEYYAQNGSWPENADAAGVPADITGTYVQSLSIENGSIVIVYGNKVNANLAGKTLVFSPGLTDKQEIAWLCANHELPAYVVERGPGPYGTDAPLKYLSADCR